MSTLSRADEVSKSFNWGNPGKFHVISKVVQCSEMDHSDLATIQGLNEF